MAAIDNQPDNKNYLSPLGFRFVLERTPKTNYFVQNVTLPNLTLGEFNVENPFVSLPYPGTKLTFAPLDISFLVNEDLENYLEIHNWLKGLGFPESFDQYSNLVRDRQRVAPKASKEFSDGSLVILSSHQNPNLRITFQDMFPIALTDLSFSSTLADVDYLTATVTFRYRQYVIEKI